MQQQTANRYGLSVGGVYFLCRHSVPYNNTSIYDLFVVVGKIHTKHDHTCYKPQGLSASWAISVLSKQAGSAVYPDNCIYIYFAHYILGIHMYASKTLLLLLTHLRDRDGAGNGSPQHPAGPSTTRHLAAMTRFTHHRGDAAKIHTSKGRARREGEREREGKGQGLNLVKSEQCSPFLVFGNRMTL